MMPLHVIFKRIKTNILLFEPLQLAYTIWEKPVQKGLIESFNGITFDINV